MANRSRGHWDIVLDGGDLIMGFSLAREQDRPAVVSTELSPARLDEQVRNADVPRVIDNLDAGMGFSRRVEDVPNGYAYTLPGYCRAPGGIFSPAGKVTEIPLPAGTSFIHNSVWFRDRVYLLNQGRQVVTLRPDWSGADIVQTFGVNFDGQSGAVFNNKLYIGGGGGLVNQDGATGTWSAVAPLPRNHLSTVSWRPLGIPTQILLAATAENGWSSVRWCPITGNPMDDAAWSAPVAIGSDGRWPISRIVTAPRHAYMYRVDGIFDMDELGTRAFNIARWVTEDVDISNALWGTSVGAGLYYAHGGGLAYVPTADGEAQYSPEWAQPGWGLPYEGQVRGVPTAGALHSGWLLAALLDYSYTSYLTAGRRDPSGGTYGASTHVWHGAEAIVTGRITHMQVYQSQPPSGWPRLLICTWEPGTPDVFRAYWQSLTKVGTPLQEMLWGEPFQPADSASLFLPADAWDRPSAVKTMLQFEMVTERLTPGSDTLRVYAAADAGAYVEQGLAESGSYTSLAPLELVEGRYIKTRIDALGSPILRSFELRAALGVELREARVYRVVLGYDNALKTARGRENRDPMQRFIDLQTMLGRVIILEDGVPMRVRVLQVMAPERRQLGTANRDGAWALVCEIAVSILDHPFRWDGAASSRYDTDRTWN